MNPFEFVIAIVGMVFLYKLLTVSIARRHQKNDGRSDSAAIELQRSLEKLEERVRVLERIVTDERFDLKQQFKDLGT